MEIFAATDTVTRLPNQGTKHAYLLSAAAARTTHA
jgi:hypothetical protein